MRKRIKAKCVYAKRKMRKRINTHCVNTQNAKCVNAQTQNVKTNKHKMCLCKTQIAYLGLYKQARASKRDSHSFTGATLLPDTL